MRLLLLAAFVVVSFSFSTSIENKPKAEMVMDCEPVFEWGNWSGNGCGSRLNKIVNVGGECGNISYEWQFRTCSKKPPKPPGNPY
ncbi:hypothetical protein [Flagellimonas pacifica]|uniref:Uncharacterized protein n=1 Tax=Flagellimonas pacifica TaxID=1247520 RepID=A0A285MIM3_9FLAO|nr:hypothetical protein [Allomuricauda parva]SNY95351.1 hypothetical protein SAMN06265377_1019 [Allomuricauda parva]